MIFGDGIKYALILSFKFPFMTDKARAYILSQPLYAGIA